MRNKRRSSILKQPCLSMESAHPAASDREPLKELLPNAEADFDDITTMTVPVFTADKAKLKRRSSMKRVSFSHADQVKEFRENNYTYAATEPEWESTYYVSKNASSSTSESTDCQMDMTRIEDVSSEVKNDSSSDSHPPASGAPIAWEVGEEVNEVGEPCMMDVTMLGDQPASLDDTVDGSGPGRLDAETSVGMDMTSVTVDSTTRRAVTAELLAMQVEAKMVSVRQSVLVNRNRIDDHDEITTQVVKKVKSNSDMVFVCNSKTPSATSELSQLMDCDLTLGSDNNVRVKDNGNRSVNNADVDTMDVSSTTIKGDVDCQSMYCDDMEVNSKVPVLKLASSNVITGGDCHKVLADQQPSVHQMVHCDDMDMTAAVPILKSTVSNFGVNSIHYKSSVGEPSSALGHHSDDCEDMELTSAVPILNSASLKVIGDSCRRKVSRGQKAMSEHCDDIEMTTTILTGKPALSNVSTDNHRFEYCDDLELTSAVPVSKASSSTVAKDSQFPQSMVGGYQVSEERIVPAWKSASSHMDGHHSMQCNDMNMTSSSVSILKSALATSQKYSKMDVAEGVVDKSATARTCDAVSKAGLITQQSMLASYAISNAVDDLRSTVTSVPVAIAAVELAGSEDQVTSSVGQVSFDNQPESEREKSVEKLDIKWRSSSDVAKSNVAPLPTYPELNETGDVSHILHGKVRKHDISQSKVGIESKPAMPGSFCESRQVHAANKASQSWLASDELTTDFASIPCHSTMIEVGLETSALPSKLCLLSGLGEAGSLLGLGPTQAVSKATPGPSNDDLAERYASLNDAWPAVHDHMDKMDKAYAEKRSEADAMLARLTAIVNKQSGEAYDSTAVPNRFKPEWDPDLASLLAKADLLLTKSASFEKSSRAKGQFPIKCNIDNWLESQSALYPGWNMDHDVNDSTGLTIKFADLPSVVMYVKLGNFSMSSFFNEGCANKFGVEVQHQTVTGFSFTDTSPSGLATLLSSMSELESNQLMSECQQSTHLLPSMIEHIVIPAIRRLAKIQYRIVPGTTECRLLKVSREWWLTFDVVINVKRLLSGELDEVLDLSSPQMSELVFYVENVHRIGRRGSTGNASQINGVLRDIADQCWVQLSESPYDRRWTFVDLFYDEVGAEFSATKNWTSS